MTSSPRSRRVHTLARGAMNTPSSWNPSLMMPATNHTCFYSLGLTSETLLAVFHTLPSSPPHPHGFSTRTDIHDRKCVYWSHHQCTHPTVQDQQNPNPLWHQARLSTQCYSLQSCPGADHMLMQSCCRNPSTRPSPPPWPIVLHPCLC